MLKIDPTRQNLIEIIEKWILGNEGRETTDASFSLDHGHDLLDDWFEAYDQKARSQHAGS